MEKHELLQEIEYLLGLQEEVVGLCAQQLGNAAFFSGIIPQGRAEVKAELEAFQALAQQHQQTLELIMGSILSDEQDVY